VSTEWWRAAVVSHIYPRSFADAASGKATSRTIRPTSRVSSKTPGGHSRQL
jgi:hypothetical protein